MVYMITGFAQSGKDTFASALKLHIPSAGNRVEIYKFANIMKDLANRQLRFLGMKGDFHDEAFKNKHRDYLIALSRFLRSLDKDLLAKHLFAQIQGDIEFTKIECRPIAIVSDWRYANEYHFLKKHLDADIMTIEICRPGYDGYDLEERDNLTDILSNCKIDCKRMASDAATLNLFAKDMAQWKYPNLY